MWAEDQKQQYQLEGPYRVVPQSHGEFFTQVTMNFCQSHRITSGLAAQLGNLSSHNL